MFATVSLNSLLAHEPCDEGFEAFKLQFGHLDPDTPVPLLACLESNSVPDVIWALRAVQQDISTLIPLIAADFVESVLHLFEEKSPGDDRPRKAIEAARGGDKEKAACAADAAAYAAASAAADAARAACAGNAAYAAASAARAAAAAGGIAATDAAAGSASGTGQYAAMQATSLSVNAGAGSGPSLAALFIVLLVIAPAIVVLAVQYGRGKPGKSTG